MLGEMRLRHLITALSVFMMGLNWSACRAQPLEASQVALTNAAQIRRLSAEHAGQSIPVHLRGVVMTEAGPSGNRAAVIWDQTAGIYLLGKTNEFERIQRGDLVEVTGVTDPGEFAPIVKVSTVNKLGTARTPDPTPVTFEKLLTGGLDAQWVEISGIVRNLDTNSPGIYGLWHMELASGGGKVSVVSNEPRPPDIVPDAQVEVQATCFYQFTQQRQVLRPMLLVPTGVRVQVETPAPRDGYASAVRPAGSLLEFSPDSGSGRRVHVRGTVTHQEPGHVVWIRDNSGALAVQSGQTDPLQPGDQIDVLGFPKYGSYTPALEDAVFRKFGRIDSPVPVLITNPAAAFDHQADLVSLTATLKDIQPIPDGQLLALEAEGAAFKAALKQSHDVTSPQYEAGSVVRVTGICSVSGDEAGPVVSGIWHPQTFQILLRSVGDIAVIRAPPWWTARRVMFVLLLVTGGSLAVTGLVMWLARRHLHEEAARRAMAEAEFTAILAERNRVAREIHDTLAQGLAATSVHLRLAKKSANGSPGPVVHHLDVAQQLVRDSLEEARNSIWNMRSNILEHKDLAGALQDILTHLADGTELDVNFETFGRVRRLSPVVENNLLRIGQEAISNAAKHARAKHIRVSIDFGEKRLGLVVADDGKGFDCSKTTPRTGGFGLVGMRERAADLKGDLEIGSVAGRGTTVNLSVPISGD